MKHASSFLTLALAMVLAAPLAHAQMPAWTGAVQTTNPNPPASGSTTAYNPNVIGHDISVDATGNAYVGGFLGDERTATNTCTRTFGSTTLSTTGISGFIAKLSPTLQWQWALKASTLEHNFSDVSFVTPSPAGDVYANINVEDDTAPSTITVGSLSAISSSAHAIAVTKVSAAGQPQWIATGILPTATGRAEVSAIGWDASTGSLVVVGNYRRSALVFGSFTLPLPANDRAIFIARVSPTGQWLSATSSLAASTGSLAVDAATVSPQGRVAVAYRLQGGSMTLGATSVSTTGTGSANARVGVAQFTSAGQGLSLLASTGASNSGFSFSQVRYASDNATLWLLLDYGVGVGFGGTTLSGTPQITAIKVTAQGSWDLVRPVASTSTSTSGAPLLEASLTLDRQDNVLLTGSASAETYTFGTRQLVMPVTAYSNIFLARLSSTGQWLSAQLVNPGLVAGSSSFLEVRGSALASGNTLLVLGGLNGGRATFGNGVLNNAGNTDAFVAQLANAGTLAMRQAAGAAPLAVFPNPAVAGNATLRLATPATVALPFALRDALGRVIRTGTVPAGRQEMALPTAGLAPGLYLLEAGASRAQLVVE